MFNEMCYIKVSTFNGDNAKVDKHGLDPLYFELLSGTMPNRPVQSGTMCERKELKVGDSAIINFTERAPSKEFGRQFSFSRIMPVTTVHELKEAMDCFGKPVMLNVD